MKPNSPPTPLRFMQIALLSTIFFSFIYIGQFITRSSTPLVVDNDINLRTELQSSVRTQVILQGFEAGYQYVNSYNVMLQGPLYILFMSNTDTNGQYWCPDCQRAQQPVYNVFSHTRLGSTLVEIRVGTREEWRDENNPFRQNELFYIDNIPTLLKYNGNGNSSRMLIEEYTLNQDLLEYVFDIDPPHAGIPHLNTIKTCNQANQVQEMILQHDHSYPLFIFFISGVHSFNGRLWCPYCDRSDVAVMHYYNYSAPSNAVLIRAIVSNTYQEWKESNPFRHPTFATNVVQLRGVPYLGRVEYDPITKRNKLQEYTHAYSDFNTLSKWFKDLQLLE